MAAVGYAPRALRDLERVVAFAVEHEPATADAVTQRVLRAVELLAESPLIGRPVEAGLRELVVSRGRTGYVVLYRFDAERDRVLVLALRHQREAGFSDPQAE